MPSIVAGSHMDATPHYISITSGWDCNKSTKPRNKSLWQQTNERLSKLPYYSSFSPVHNVQC